MADSHWALIVGFPSKGPHKRLPQAQGGLHYRGAVHQAFDNRITVSMEPPVTRYPLLAHHDPGLRVITFRDRFNHIAQVPSGGVTEIYAAWNEDGRTVLASEDF
jgi:hypothetical protein